MEDKTEHTDVFHEINLQDEMIDLVFGEFGFNPGSDLDEPKQITLTDFELKMMLVKAYTLGCLQTTSDYIMELTKNMVDNSK